MLFGSPPPPPLPPPPASLLDAYLVDVDVRTQYMLLVLLQIPVWLFAYTYGIQGLEFALKCLPRAAGFVQHNAEADARNLGVPEEEAVLVQGGKQWAFDAIVNVHHAFGALAALGGYVLNSPALFRLGIGSEIAEDIIHYGQMIQCKLFPPGPFPLCMWPTVLWVLMGMHHSLGLICGSAAFVHMADDEDVQYLVFVLLAAVLPNLPAPLFKAGADLQRPSITTSLNALTSAVTLAVITYTRAVVGAPLMWRLERRMFAAGGALGYVCLGPIVLMNLFTFVMCAFYFGQALQALGAASGSAERKAAITKAQSVADLSAGVVSLQAQLSFMPTDKHLFIDTVRLVAWRKRAHDHALAARKKED